MQQVAHQPIPASPVVAVAGAVVTTDAVWIYGGVPA